MKINTAKLKGEYVYLKELEEQNIPKIKTLIKDERLWEFTKTFVINETFNQQFENYISVALNPESEGIFGVGLQKTFVIYKRDDDSIIGMTRYYGLSEKHKRVDIGYTWYVPEVWGKVHNKECKLLLLQYAFETLGFNRVGFHVAHVNTRSQKAVEKIGGVKEGVLRKHSYQADGSERSTVLFSIIIDEWPVKKKLLIELIKQEAKK